MEANTRKITQEHWEGFIWDAFLIQYDEFRWTIKVSLIVKSFIQALTTKKIAQQVAQYKMNAVTVFYFLLKNKTKKQQNKTIITFKIITDLLV